MSPCSSSALGSIHPLDSSRLPTLTTRARSPPSPLDNSGKRQFVRWKGPSALVANVISRPAAVRCSLHFMTAALLHRPSRRRPARSFSTEAANVTTLDALARSSGITSTRAPGCARISAASAALRPPLWAPTMTCAPLRASCFTTALPARGGESVTLVARHGRNKFHASQRLLLYSLSSLPSLLTDARRSTRHDKSLARGLRELGMLDRRGVAAAEIYRAGGKERATSPTHDQRRLPEEAPHGPVPNLGGRPVATHPSLVTSSSTGAVTALVAWQRRTSWEGGETCSRRRWVLGFA